MFLDRALLRRRSTGAVISPEFVELHYPLYWHYDILGGLKVMAVSNPWVTADALSVLAAAGRL